jgi:peptide-methionine (S)-S-oxide reductase
MALDFPEPDADTVAKPDQSEAVAVFAGGCFWCTEAVYRELDGVTDVKAGYAGGTKETADYKWCARAAPGMPRRSRSSTTRAAPVSASS